MFSDDSNHGWMVLLDVLRVGRFECLARCALWGIFLLMALLTSVSEPSSSHANMWLLGLALFGFLWGLTGQALGAKDTGSRRWGVISIIVDIALLAAWASICLFFSSPSGSLLPLSMLGVSVVMQIAAVRWHVPSVAIAGGFSALVFGVLGSFYLAVRPKSATGELSLSMLTMVGIELLLVLGGVVMVMVARQGVALRHRLEKVDRLQRRLLNQVSDAVLICSVDGRVLDGNAAAEELVHMGRSVFVTKRVTAVLPSSLAAVVDDAWSTAKADGVVMAQDVRQRDSSGRAGYYSVQLHRHKLEDQSLMQLVIRDSSSEHNLDEQEAHMGRLKSLRKLSRGIAHDFNNMFATIQASSFLLEESIGDRPSELVEVHAIREATGRAVQLVNQIVDLTDIRTPVIKQLEVPSLVHDVLEGYHLDSSNIIDVNVELHDEALRVLGDKDQLQRALSNIVGCCVGSMIDGGTLTITAQTLLLTSAKDGLAPGTYLEMTISDTGIGIPADMVERAFDPFFSDDGGRWTGFALANARAVVAFHGGQVRLESDLGHGSSYRIMLPATQVAEAIPPSSEHWGKIDHHEGNVLVVDDDRVSLQSMVRLLESRGYNVFGSQSGREAIESCERRSGDFDVVVLDMLMPGLSGKDVLETIHSRYPDIRVLVVTGYAEQGLVDEASEMGAAAYLHKPFDVPEFLEKVRLLARDKHEID